MRDIINKLRAIFEKVQTSDDLPGLLTVTYLHSLLDEAIPTEVLAVVLGRMKIQVTSHETYEALREEGVLDEFARVLMLLYDYSMLEFGSALFFIESGSQLELEFRQ